MKNNHIPLIVDLDGTLIKNDTLIESIVKSINKKFVNLFLIIIFFFNKKKLKIFLNDYKLDINEIYYNKKVIDIIDQNFGEREIILCTGSSNAQSQVVFNSFKKFDKFYSSSKKINLVGKSKSNFLIEKFGKNNFDYIGNSFADIHVWKNSRIIYYAGQSDILLKLINLFFSKKKIVNLNLTGSYRDFFKQISKLIRVNNWIKNMLIFCPIFLANQINFNNIITCIQGFIIFSLFSSLTYIVNDTMDLHSDRIDKLKKKRPLSAFKLDINIIKFLIPILIFFIVFLLSFFSYENNLIFILLGYFFLTISYTFLLKNLFMVDIIALSIFYFLRIYFGSEITDTEISKNLIYFSFPFFIFLASVKRNIEIDNFDNQEINVNLVSKKRLYSEKNKKLLNFIMIFTFVVSQFYIVNFIFSDSITIYYKNQIIPFILIFIFIFWCIRIIYLTLLKKINLDPIEFAIKDKISITVGILMILLFSFNLI